MIPLINIFEYVRKQKKYQRTQLLKTTGLSSDQVRYHIETEQLPDQYIVPWCEFLDIFVNDYSAIYQYNARHRLYCYVRDGWPHKNPSPLALQLTTNLMFFANKIDDWQPLIRAGLPVTLKHIEVMPYTLANANSDLTVLAEKGERFDNDE